MSERWPGLLTREGAAEYLNVSVETVSREKAAGRIKSVLIRGMVRYSRESLDAYIRDLPEGSGECAANEVRDRKRSEERNKQRQSRRDQTQPAA